MCPTHWDAEMTFYRTFSFNWQFGKLVEYSQTASDISHAIIWECQSYSRHKLSKLSIFCRKNHQKYEYTPYVVWFGHIAKHCSAGVNLTLLPANRRHRSLHILQFSICVWYYEIFLWHNAHKTSYHYIYTAMTHDYLFYLLYLLYLLYLPYQIWVCGWIFKDFAAPLAYVVWYRGTLRYANSYELYVALIHIRNSIAWVGVCQCSMFCALW